MMDDKQEQARWQAVAGRDKGKVGQFVYGVATTGIYCNPGCPSKMPDRKNVTFFDHPIAAEKAGFRPCKRCKPEAETGPDRQRVLKACQTIEAAETEPSLNELAKEAGLSASHFQRLFKREIGLSPKQYAMAIRKQRFRDGLREGARVTDVIYGAGYDTSSRAYAQIKGAGMAPGLEVRGGPGETIRLMETTCSLGPLFIAATDKGLCMVEFGTVAEIMPRLVKKFPKAEIMPDNGCLKAWADAIVAKIENPRNACDLPLDIRGTVFQEKVWRELATIPAGETVSYADLAEKIGNPKAVRAVASANGANCLAVLVPCHRVIGKSGNLAGYKWGLDRKKALIEREKKA